MPTYEFVCLNCDFKFERFERLSNVKIRQCPKCKRRKAKRQIGCGGGIIFRGPGFYSTDSKSQL